MATQLFKLNYFGNTGILRLIILAAKQIKYILRTLVTQKFSTNKYCKISNYETNYLNWQHSILVLAHQKNSSNDQ